ncbi:acyloxyacyl hydrolase [Robertkochia marina]|uniref:Acyloxyacyl hydrolase n=1 Tax=Robertkochia marina TaxID=1227945 RepID=A0A4S3M1E8_9FLAO|nr:acyloxyacyl hydrolase [Robertkochia marina]THD68914.1 acyloxyacyl hydrolase [Robertkochia marina]TRZ44736.1 acyloxyacyl hydrolase [Robertkochia marina]
MSPNRLIFFLLSFCCFSLSFAQEERNNAYIDVQYFQGTVMEHNVDILHLITGYPNGVILSWNKRTDGSEEWHELYNYPDFGVSFNYQDLKNENLGENYGLYAHYNFYFLKRSLMFRIGTGIGMSTNPYDRETNYRNNVYGSRFLSATYMMLNYKKERIIDRWGINLGLSLIHYSNANIKAPNTSTNSIVATIGANYDLDSEPMTYEEKGVSLKFTEPVRYNFVFRSGVNESDIVGSGQFPFYVGSFYADKRINKKSALQLGADVFFADFLIEYNRHRAIAYPWENRTGQEDYRRVGLFAGHELFMGKLSLLTQFGYYVYYPIDYEDEIYHRVGIKRYFGEDFFAAVSLKTHWAKAEALEFGIGYRL